MKWNVFSMILLIIGIILNPQTSRSKDLVVAAFNIPPFYMLNDPSVEKIHVEGIHVEIIKEIAARLKVNVEYEECGWARCLDWMEQGKLDLMPYLLKKPDREKYMLYIDPPYFQTTYNTFYLNKGKGHLVKKYEDLYQFEEIGVVNQARYFPRFDNDSKLKKYKVTSSIHQLRMLKERHIKIIIGQQLAYDYLISKQGFSNYTEKAHYKYKKSNPGFMAISKKSPFAKQIHQFNRVMKELVTEGVIEDIKKQFLK